MSGAPGDAVTLEILDERREGDQRLEQRLRVPAELPCLEGHFPGVPVLPGVAQLGWVVEAAGRLRGRPVTPSGIEALKFRELLRPGDTFTARVEIAGGSGGGSGPGASGGIRFSVEREGRVAASGRLRFAGAADRPLGNAEVPEPAAQPIPAADLIPHAGPMVFLDELIATDEKRSVCSVRIDDLPLFRDANGALPAWAGVEPMAQCIAAHGGLEALRNGEAPKVGFLLGCRRLEIQADRLSPGIAYAAAASQVWGRDQGLVSFDCEIFERKSGRRLLAGRINAYLPADLDDVLEGQLG